VVCLHFQAGELGAQQIYAGQLFVMRGTTDEPILQVLSLSLLVLFDALNVREMRVTNVRLMANAV
jgi:hypothetical protein